VRCTWNVGEMHMKYGWDAHEIWVRCTWNMGEMHMKYGWDAHEIWVRCTWNMGEMHMKYGWDAHEIWVRCTWNMGEMHMKCKFRVLNVRNCIQICFVYKVTWKIQTCATLSFACLFWTHHHHHHHHHVIDDRSITCSKSSSLDSTIYCLLFQFAVSSIFLEALQ